MATGEVGWSQVVAGEKLEKDEVKFESAWRTRCC
jgi:hypothetical protein